MCTVLLPPGVNQIAVKYTSIYIYSIINTIYIYIYIYCNINTIKILSGKYRIIRNDCWGFNNLSCTDATPCDFLLWGYVKDQVYVPLPANIPVQKVRTRTATETTTAEMLQTVWNELDYRVAVCRITNGAHIERL
jgi:hypothetical protein